MAIQKLVISDGLHSREIEYDPEEQSNIDPEEAHAELLARARDPHLRFADMEERIKKLMAMGETEEECEKRKKATQKNTKENLKVKEKLNNYKDDHNVPRKVRIQAEFALRHLEMVKSHLKHGRTADAVVDTMLMMDAYQKGVELSAPIFDSIIRDAFDTRTKGEAATSTNEKKKAKAKNRIAEVERLALPLIEKGYTDQNIAKIIAIPGFAVGTVRKDIGKYRKRIGK